MGIVQRESLANSVAAYAGIAIGFVNKVLLFPRFLAADELGLANVIVLVATVYAQFSALGFPNAILRYFPFFRSEEHRHRGFVAYIFGLSALAFLATTLLFFAFRPVIFRAYANAPLLLEYYVYVVPLALATLGSNLLQSYLRSLYRTAFASFVTEVFLRVTGTLAISLLALGFVDFPVFVVLYVTGFCLSTLLLVVYLGVLGQLFLVPVRRATGRLKRLRRSVLVYSGFSMAGNVTATLMTIVDALMIAGFLGLGDAGIYTTMVYAVSVVMVPSRAMYKIVYPLVAEHWKNKRLDLLGKLYESVTSVNLAISLLLIVGLLANLDNLFQPPFLPESFTVGRIALLVLVVARIADIGTGINGVIIMTSKAFRVDLAYTVVLLVTTVATNYLLIPRLGITGAALATAITIVLFNGSRLIFVYRRFRIQPFAPRSAWILLLSAVSLGAGLAMPTLSSVLLDVVVRSALVATIYGGLLLGTRLAPELNDYLVTIGRRALAFRERRPLT